MTLQNSNKLQIRAEVLSILQKISPISDHTTDNIEKSIEQLKLISDRHSAIEILLKELIKSQDEKLDLIAILIIELADISDIKETLWKYIKTPKYSDTIKEISATILKAKGEIITTESLTNFFHDPDTVIDSETQKLLDTAKVNPEAQIDFLDFLQALETKEQLQLVSSLKDDYDSLDLLNIIIPILYSNLKNEVKELAINIMGETKSHLAVNPLKDIINYSSADSLKKHANKSLAMLKLAGIDVEKNDLGLGSSIDIKERFRIHNCYTSLTDGTGHQGLIISRKDKDDNIYMFSVVINDTDGIIDCFGFNSILEEEFDRIIKRFSKASKVILVEPDYCKRTLVNAEQINKQKNMTIPYEYMAWRIMTTDILPSDNFTDKNLSDWGNNDIYLEYKEILYSSNDFNTWFIDENHSEQINSFLDSTVNKMIENIIKPDLNNIIVSDIKNNIKQLITPEIILNIKKRLISLAELYNINNEIPCRNTVSSIYKYLDDKDLSKNEFLIDIIKRSISEKILREKEKCEENSKTQNIFKKNKINASKWDICKLNKLVEIISKDWI